MGEKKVKGPLIKSYLRFIKKKWGGDGLDQCCYRAGISLESISGTQWYDLKFALKILEYVNEKGGLTQVEKCGSEVLEDIGAIAYLVKLSDMKTVLKRTTTQGYNSSFDFGQVSFELTDKNKAVIKMTGHSESELMCHAWIGSLKGAMNLKKVKGQIVETQCEAKGAKNCEFQITWE